MDIKYKKELEKKREDFEKLLFNIEKAKYFSEKLVLAKTALTYATNCNMGYYVSHFLEKFYTDYAKSIDIKDYDIEYEPNSFLHVMTEAYNIGGHTRVVERWIENAPQSQKHSVVATSANEEKIIVLEKNIAKKNGKYIKFDKNLSLEERALKLRELGMHYQYIILHTHMDDPTATVAFGTEKFTRPVILYNHASHLFWIGKSIADKTLDILKNDSITRINRGIKDIEWVSIPTVLKDFSDDFDKTNSRKKLGIPVDKKIIISSGSKNKYKSDGENNIIDIILPLANGDNYFYFIGPSIDDAEWKEANEKSNGHIVPLGYVNFNNGYFDYIKSADLYLDSLPFNGWTAMLDAVAANVPALTYTGRQLDYFMETDGICNSKEEYVEKIKRILADENYANSMAEYQNKMMYEMQSKEAWNKRLELILESLPQKHTVKDLSQETENKEIIDLCVTNNFSYNKNFMKRNILKNTEYLILYYTYRYILKNKNKYMHNLLNYYISL